MDNTLMSDSSDGNRRQTYFQRCSSLLNGVPPKWPRANKDGKPYNDIINAKHFLKITGVDVIYDAFARRFLISGLPGYFELDDEAMRELRITMSLFGLDLPKESFKEWLLYIAQQRPMHPVMTYLNGLTWDGVPRLDTWITKHCSVPDCEYVRAVAAIMLIAAVRRVLQPGVKFDTMVVFEGSQGQGKSSIPRALATDSFFSDDLKLGHDSKEVIEKTAGKWIVEIAELHGLSNREIEAIKSFISRQWETARGAYRAHANTIARQFILVGTTNDKKYLKDPTGNRRFLPIAVPGDAGSIDVDGLIAARDQLWAEAVHREKEGESISLPPHLWSVANTEQHARLIVDPKAELLQDLLEGLEGFVATDSLFDALGLDPERRELRHQQLISTTMHNMGWEQPNNALAVHDEDGTASWRRRGWRKGAEWRANIVWFDRARGRFVTLTHEELLGKLESDVF